MGEPTSSGERENSLRSEMPELHEDVQTTIRLRAIMSVSGPHEIACIGAVTRCVDPPMEGTAKPVWVIPPPGHRRAVDRAGAVQALWVGLDLDAVHGPRPRRLADAEDRIVAALGRGPRLVIVLGTHQFGTMALGMLYGMWAHLVPGKFPLVLVGHDSKMERVLDRPPLDSLKSCIFMRRRIAPPPA